MINASLFTCDHKRPINNPGTFSALCQIWPSGSRLVPADPGLSDPGFRDRIRTRRAAINHYPAFILMSNVSSVSFRAFHYIWDEEENGECVNLDESCVFDVLGIAPHSRPGYHHITQCPAPQGASVMVTQTGTCHWSSGSWRQIRCFRAGEMRQFPSVSVGCHNYVGISIIMSASGVGFLRGRAKLITWPHISASDPWHTCQEAQK